MSISLEKYASAFFGKHLKNSSINEICYNGDDKVWFQDSKGEWQCEDSKIDFDGASAFAQACASYYGEGHRLLTAHSRTERGERGQPHRQINDLNFHNSANEDIIPQNQNQSQESLGKNPSDSKQEKMNALREQVNNIAKNKTNSPKDLSPKIDKER